MAQKVQQKEVIPRPEDYEKFRAAIKKILKQAKKPLTWTEIKAKAGFTQKVPNNKWVKWKEVDNDHEGDPSASRPDALRRR